MNRLMRIVAATSAALAIGAGAATAQSQLPVTEEDFQTVQSIPTGTVPTKLTYAYGAPWVISQGDSRLWRINPVTGSTTRRTLPSTPRDLASGFNRIWVLSSKGNRVVVSEFDRQGRLKRRIARAFPGGANILRVGAGRVWVAGVDTSSRLLEVNPRNGKTKLHRWPTPLGFTVAGGSLWTMSKVVSSDSGIQVQLLQQRSPKNPRRKVNRNHLDATPFTGTPILTHLNGAFYYSTGRSVFGMRGDAKGSGAFAEWGYRGFQINCLVGGAGSIWVAQGGEGIENGIPTTTQGVAALDPEKLTVALTDSPFPPGSMLGSVGCITPGGGSAWVTDGDSLTYQLATP